MEMNEVDFHDQMFDVLEGKNDNSSNIKLKCRNCNDAFWSSGADVAARRQGGRQRMANQLVGAIQPIDPARRGWDSSSVEGTSRS